MLKPTPITCSAISVNNEITLFHTGPSLDKGPMATVFYFALSGEDSLCLDPFNQIVRFLSDYNIRIFSMTLPAHEANLPPQNAINVWAEDIGKGRNIIQDFCELANTAIDFVIQKGFAIEDKIALAGLSRGGFIASHLAAINDNARFLLLFAPLTDLKLAKEFENVKDHPIIHSLDLAHITKKICNRHIRAYIGNRDKRVSTRSTFDFIENLSNQAFDKKMRSPQVELIISPSIGHLGHGTPPQTFKSGADWLIECLL